MMTLLSTKNSKRAEDHYGETSAFADDDDDDDGDDESDCECPASYWYI